VPADNSAIQAVTPSQIYAWEGLEPVGVGATSQPLMPTGEQSGLQTRIATTESVSLCARMKSWRRFWNCKGRSVSTYRANNANRHRSDGRRFVVRRMKSCVFGT
jgi:hypothetical protein